MARLVGLSESGLRALFRRELACSPQQAVKRLRLEQARIRLLNDPSLRIKQVMSDVGCGDQSHFARDFAREYRVSPSKLRIRDVI